MKRIINAIMLFAPVLAMAAGLSNYATLRPETGAPAENVIWFGWSLAAGDFNGDGNIDAAVGAPRSDRPGDPTESVVGRVYIYFGPIPPGELTPDMTSLGENSRDQFGIALASPGDFDGDGYDDLVVGANVWNRTGAAYLFSGGPGFDDIPEAIFPGEEVVDNFGFSSSGVGDQNGDGLADIMIGALYNDAGGWRSGRTYLYYGSATYDTVPDMIFTGLDSLDDFGVVIDGPFDFDADLNPDFCIGAVQAGGYWYKPGEGYVFYGGTDLDTNPDRTFTGTHPSEFFGNSLAALGDVNGDGYDDAVFAGYNHHEPPDSGVGRILLVLGAPWPGPVTLNRIGGRANQNLGGEVASAGDIDFDGLAEFAVSMTYSPDGDSAGFVEICGVESGTLAVDTSCWNPHPDADSWFGYRLKYLDDVAGDGMRYFAVSDPARELSPDTSFQTGGVVYIYRGWRESYPVTGRIIRPESTVVTSACPRQEVAFRLYHPSGLSDIRVLLSVSAGEDEFAYTLDSAELSMEDDSTLVFRPGENWPDYTEILVTLEEALKMENGEALVDLLAAGWLSDLSPPEITPLVSGGITDDPYPLYLWEVSELASFLNTHHISVTCGDDSVYPELVWYHGEVETDDRLVYLTLSDLDRRIDHGGSITVCLNGVRDDPSAPCGPNISEPNCITHRFLRQYSADLVLDAPGLDRTTLTLGAAIGGSDGYDPGIDVIMPPIPGTRVEASFIAGDPGYPHIHRLLRDVRDPDRDTLSWRIALEGDESVTLRWNPEALPAGIWLLNGRVDMHYLSEAKFAGPDTVAITFQTGPKETFLQREILTSSWSLISSPLYLDEFLVDSLMNRAYLGSPYYFFSWDPERGSYETPERWPTGRGLWFWGDGNLRPLVLSGWEIDTLTPPMSPGWNLIGAPADTTPVSLVGTEPPGALISGMIFEYGSLSGYDEAEELLTGEGYWALATESGEFWIPGDGSRHAAKLGAPEAWNSSPPPPPTIGGKSPLPREIGIAAYPNPFNSAVQICISCPAGVGASSARPGQVGGIEIYDISGRLVADLAAPSAGTGADAKTPSGNPAEGPTPVVWQPSENIGSGVYLVRATIGEETYSRPVVYVK